MSMRLSKVNLKLSIILAIIYKLSLNVVIWLFSILLNHLHKNPK